MSVPPLATALSRDVTTGRVPYYHTREITTLLGSYIHSNHQCAREDNILGYSDFDHKYYTYAAFEATGLEMESPSLKPAIDEVLSANREADEHLKKLERPYTTLCCDVLFFIVIMWCLVWVLRYTHRINGSTSCKPMREPFDESWSALTMSAVI